MENNTTCFSCDFTLDKLYKFCPSCGANIKCKNCDTLLIKGAKFCFNCGNNIHEENQITVNENINTIKFKETKDEREYEVRFTNETASQVTNVVSGMIPNSSNIFKITGKGNGLVEYEVVDEVKDNSGESSNLEPISSTENQVVDNFVESDNNSIFPHVNDLTIKYTNFNEKDWILVFAFYLSNFGSNQFTREAVYEKYKEDRFTSARGKNFAGIWKKLFKENFATIKDNNLILTPVGLENAKKLLNSQSEKLYKTNKVKTNVHNKTLKSVAQQSIKLEEFDIYEKGTLQSFIEKFNATSTKEYILCIGYFITKILEKESFSDGNVDYAFKVLKLPNRPNALRQIIINIKNNELWIENAEGKNWKITRPGEIEYEKRTNV